ncbi:chaperonin containing TCP1, partial [Culex quinquefasciatus]
RSVETFAEEEKGEFARLSSFMGDIAIDDLVKGTLGPKGMDKILVAHGRSAGQVEDDEIGDGTTSVTVLASEMLREAEKLIEQKLHPQTIIAGWRAATKATPSALITAAQDNPKEVEKFREDLMKIAWMTLRSKILSQQNYFVKLAVDAVMRMK